MQTIRRGTRRFDEVLSTATNIREITHGAIGGWGANTEAVKVDDATGRDRIRMHLEADPSAKLSKRDGFWGDTVDTFRVDLPEIDVYYLFEAPRA